MAWNATKGRPRNAVNCEIGPLFPVFEKRLPVADAVEVNEAEWMIRGSAVRILVLGDNICCFR